MLIGALDRGFRVEFIFGIKCKLANYATHNMLGSNTDRAADKIRPTVPTYVNINVTVIRKTFPC
jgi:hypothetical protein